jgi:predicted ArsR family transcriptional regulator
METSKFSDREKHRLLEAIDFIGTQEMSEKQRALLDKKVERALRAYREKSPSGTSETVLREAEVSTSGTGSLPES